MSLKTPDIPKLINWTFPCADSIKLNIDGAAKENPNEASFEGILHDEHGKWLGEYYVRIGTTASLVAELQSIRSGMKTAKEQGYKKLVVESNSKLAIDIDMLMDNCEVPPQTSFLMADSKVYSQKC